MSGGGQRVRFGVGRFFSNADSNTVVIQNTDENSFVVLGCGSNDRVGVLKISKEDITIFGKVNLANNLEVDNNILSGQQIAGNPIDGPNNPAHTWYGYLNTGMFLAETAGCNVAFATGGVERVRIQDGPGYVGIGTTSATHRGTFYASNDALGYRAAGLLLKNDADQGQVGIALQNRRTTGLSNWLLGMDGASSNLVLGYAPSSSLSVDPASARLLMDPAGRLSVNASTIQKETLFVQGTARATSSVETQSQFFGPPADTAANPSFSWVGAYSNTGMFLAQQQGCNVAFATGGVERVRIQDGPGYVGIGTTSATHRGTFYASNDALGYRAAGLLLKNDADQGQVGIALQNRRTTGLSNWLLGMDGASSNLVLGYAPSSDASVDPASARLLLDPAGRLAVNASSIEKETLFVQGTARATSSVETQTQFFGPPADGPANPSFSWVGAYSNTGMFLAQQEGCNVAFSTGGIERVRIQDGPGYVGIGTTSATHRGTFYASNEGLGYRAAGLLLRNDADQGQVGIALQNSRTTGLSNWLLGMDGASSNLVLGYAPSSDASVDPASARLLLDPAGRLSVNASSIEKETLFVQGTARATSSVETETQFFGPPADTAANPSFSWVGAYSNTGMFLAQQEGCNVAFSTGGVERVRIQDGPGYVGIGTTLATHRATFYASNEGLGYRAAGLLLKNDADQGQVGIALQNSRTTGLSNWLLGMDGASSNLVLGYAPSSDASVDPASARLLLDPAGRLSVNASSIEKETLFVQGTARATSSVETQSQFFGPPADGPANPSFSWVGAYSNTGMFLAQQEGCNVAFATGGVERVRIQDGPGYVGIGTTLATHRATFYASNEGLGYRAAGLLLKNDADQGQVGIALQNRRTTGLSNWLLGMDGASSNLVLGYAPSSDASVDPASARLLLDPAGRLSVNASNIQKETLFVQGTARATSSVETEAQFFGPPADTAANPSFSWVGAYSNTGMFLAQQDGCNVAFATGGVERVRIQDGPGYVGIGTTSATHRGTFYASNDALGYRAAGLLLKNDADQGQVGIALQNRRTTGLSNWLLGMDGASSNLVLGYAPSSDQSVDPASARLLLDPAGRLSVNASTIQKETLFVQGTARATSSVETEAQFFGPPADTAANPSFSWVGAYSNTGMFLAQQDGCNVAFATGGVERVRIQDGPGYVGIGTTSATHRGTFYASNDALGYRAAGLLLKNDADQGQVGIALQNRRTTGLSNWLLGMDGASSNLVLGYAPSSDASVDPASARLLLDPAGRLSVNASTIEKETLFVQGTARATSSVETQMQFFGPPADTAANPSFSWVGAYSNTGMFLAQQEGCNVAFATGGVERVRIQDGPGYVGIGTTSATHRTTFYASNEGLGYRAAGLLLRNDADQGQVGIALQNRRTTGLSNWLLGMDGASSNLVLGYAPSSDASVDPAAARLLLDPAGRLSVNASTIQKETLFVQGTARATSSVETEAQFFGPPADTAANPSFSWVGAYSNTGMFLAQQEGCNVAFATGGVERVRIQDGPGYVGIGTTSATHRTTFYASNEGLGYRAAGLLLKNDADQGQVGIALQNSRTTALSNWLLGMDGASSNLVLGYAPSSDQSVDPASARLLLDPAGRLSVNASSIEKETLFVQGTARATSSVETQTQFFGPPADGAANPSFSWVGAYSNTGMFLAQQEGCNVAFATGGVERVRIQDGPGYVGIGTTSATHRTTFYASNEGLGYRAAGLLLKNDADQGQVGIALQNSRTTALSNWLLGMDGASSNLVLGYAPSSDQSVDPASARLLLDPAGRLSVNASSIEKETLFVQGTARATSSVETQTQFFGPPADGAANPSFSWVGAYSNTGMFLAQQEGCNVAFATGGVERVRIQDGPGYVGIGTTSATHRGTFYASNEGLGYRAAGLLLKNDADQGQVGIALQNSRTTALSNWLLGMDGASSNLVLGYAPSSDQSVDPASARLLLDPAGRLSVNASSIEKETLFVQGTARATSSVETQSQFFGPPADGAANPSFSWVGAYSNTGMFLAQQEGCNVAFATGGVERVRIQDGPGYVGIGTTSATHRGTFYASNEGLGYRAAGLLLKNDADQGQVGIALQNSRTTALSNWLLGMDGASSNLVLGYAPSSDQSVDPASARLLLDPAGRLSVNASSIEKETLFVQGTARATSSVETQTQFFGPPADGAANPSFSWVGAYSNTGMFLAQQEGCNVAFATGGVERVRIQDGPGYVGIGTTSATHRGTFYASNDALGYRAAGLLLRNDADQGQVGIALQNSRTTGLSNWLLGMDGASSNLVLGYAPSSDASVDPASARLLLDPAGRLAVNASTIQKETLYVQGTARATSSIETQMQFFGPPVDGPANPSFSWVGAYSNTGMFLAQQDGCNVAFATGGVERVRIQDGPGYVGIGTSTATSMLHVFSSNTSNGASLHLQNSGIGSADLIFTNATSSIDAWHVGMPTASSCNLAVYYQTSLTSNPSIVLDSRRRVGIATSLDAPLSNELYVHGTCKISSNLFCDSVVTASNVYIHHTLQFSPLATMVRNQLQVQPVNRVEQVFESVKPTLTLTAAGAFTATADDVEVHVNGARLYNLSADFYNYTVSVTTNGVPETSFTVTFNPSLTFGDIVSIKVWPRLVEVNESQGRVLQSVNLSNVYWSQTSNSQIYYNVENARVGIATASPLATLHCQGNALVTGTTSIDTCMILNVTPDDSNSGTVTAGSNAYRVRAPYPMRLTRIPRAVLATAPGTAVELDVAVEGVSIFSGSTKLQVEMNQKSSFASSQVPQLSLSNLADDAELAVHVLQGANDAYGLKMILYYRILI